MMESRSALALVCAAVLAVLIVTPAPAVAQFADPPRPAAYALQNVTVVKADGSRMPGVTIVIRGGMIEALGPNIDIPADAELLEGDSLMVFPGLIDAQGEAEYEFPSVEIDRSQIESWAPPRSAQSFMPHRRVVDHLTATGRDLESQRKKGIVAAAVLAGGRLMPGRGALLLFRKDAETPNELVVVPALGPTMSFRGASGVYPSQVFAVMAFIRQSFEDARREGAIQEAYARDPRELATPRWDPDYAVLREALSGAQPVYFVANGAEDIRNVRKLAGEYGFRPVSVGGGEAWRVAELLKRDNVPVLVSLDFPKPERWKPEKEKQGEPPPPPPDSVAAQEPQEQEEEELDPAEFREKERLENLYANAGRLAQAGVTFALTSGGGKADMREGARKAIEYGLPEAAALRAVTSTPAGLLGVPSFVQVDEGVPATFIVTNGPLFGEETNITYTFVEGELERGTVKKEGEETDTSEAPTVDMTGTWEMDLGGELTATMKLTQKEGSLTGTLVSDFGTAQVKNGTVSGNNVSFVIVMEFGGESFEIEMEGTVEGDTASGSGDGPQGEFDWTAKRKSGPGEETRR